MTGFVDGTYTFYAWANNTLGSEDEAIIMFTISIVVPPIVLSSEVYFLVQSDNRIGVDYYDKGIQIEFLILNGTMQGLGHVQVDAWSGSLTYDSVNNAAIFMNASGYDKVTFSSGGSSSKDNMTINVAHGEHVVISWQITFSVWLPIHLALGGIGIAFLCIIPVLAIRKFRQKDYVWTLVYGSIGILVGIALIIAWLWI